MHWDRQEETWESTPPAVAPLHLLLWWNWIHVSASTCSGTLSHTFPVANNVATSQAYLKDTTGNSIHVLTNVGGVLSEFAETVVDFATPSDGTFGTVWIDYCNDTLEVFVDKDGETKPGTPQVTATVNLQGLFTGTDFFVGFTAGVQDQAQNHDIFSFEMQSKGSTC